MAIPLEIGTDVIRSYKRLSYTPWHALAEFVDNSTQSYFDHKTALDDAYAEENEQLEVRFVYDRPSNVLRISDNAMGMDLEELRRSLRIGKPPANTSGRSQYGLGMKTASCWFGDEWTVTTKKLGEEFEYSVTVDVEKVADGDTDLQDSAIPKATGLHYTTVEIRRLHSKLIGRTIGKIKQYLRSMYRVDLREGRLKMFWEGDPIEWNVSHQFLRNRNNEPYYKEFQFDVNGKRASGHIAILGEGSSGRPNAGFSILRRGRVIRGHPDSWRPEEIFGQEQGSNNLINQRITGEINLDMFEVSHTKDDILWQEDEEDEVQKRLKEQAVDFIGVAKAHRKGKKDARGPTETEVQTAVDELKSELESQHFVDLIELETVPPPEVVKSADTPMLEAAEREEPRFRVSLGDLTLLAFSRGILDRTHLRRWHGGDLEGVRQKLPYLRDLGVTAIWMNPIYDNTNTLDYKEVYDGQPTTAYHGYHAIDYYAVDERFGDMQALRRLVDEAHAQGIKVILDMVANHTSPHHPWVQDSPTPTWYNGTADRHLANNWQIWTLADPHATPEIRRPVLDGWFVDILPDLNQDDPEVARYIIQNTLWWTAMSGIDGIRQDTWPYVPRSFWREWMAAIQREHPRMRVVGEVYDGDPATVSFFSGGRARWDGIDDGVDALFDFPLFFPLRRAFVEGKPLREVVQMLGRDHLYEDPRSLVTFLGLHDVGRFMGERGATPEGLRLAYTFLLTTRGTPLLYYGDEIGLPGGGDPDNRRDFPGGWPGDPRNAFQASGRTPAEQATFAHVQRLLRLRAQRGELRQAPVVNLHVGDQQYVYRRGATVVALNNDTTAAEVRIPAVELGPDVLGQCAQPRRDGDAVVITIPPRTGCVF